YFYKGTNSKKFPTSCPLYHGSLKCDENGKYICKDSTKINFPLCNKTFDVLDTDACLNGGTFIRSNLNTDRKLNNFMCKCQTEFYGKLCQHSLGCFHAKNSTQNFKFYTSMRTVNKSGPKNTENYRSLHKRQYKM
ncbi:hypothetical protein MXB_1466, partial [Myxobolus squamalis]